MDMEIIADVDFNRDDDKEEFGCHRRIVDITRDETAISFSFLLERKGKNDALVTLCFNLSELLLKLGKLIL